MTPLGAVRCPPHGAVREKGKKGEGREEKRERRRKEREKRKERGRKTSLRRPRVAAPIPGHCFPGMDILFVPQIPSQTQHMKGS